MAQKRIKKQVELIYNKNHFLMDSLRHITDVFGIMSLITFCFCLSLWTCFCDCIGIYNFLYGYLSPLYRLSQFYLIKITWFLKHFQNLRLIIAFCCGKSTCQYTGVVFFSFLYLTAGQVFTLEFVSLISLLC